MKLLKLSIERPVFITMIAVFFMVVGIIAIFKLPVDLYPSISYPVLAVRADLSGAAPEEMEQLVTKRLEDELSTLAGIKTMRSMSREGFAMVMLEFDIGVDIRFQEIQARAKLGNLKRSLPSNLGEPVIYRQDPDDEPIIEIAVSGNRSASELTDIADNVIAKRIRQIEGVGTVDLSGARTKEIRVELNPQIVDSLKINATEVVQAIQKSNRNDPVGKLKGTDNTWVIRYLAQANSVNDLKNIYVGKNSQGNPILLRDIATLKETYAEVQRVSRISDGKTLQPAVVVEVTKQSGENTVLIADKITAILKELREDIPADVKIDIARDNSTLIRTNVADVYESLVTAAILTIIVVLLFLQSYRSTLTTGLALPSSVITTFIVMYAAGFTINIMTMLALSLSIGLLVDDAIVVRENIYRHLRFANQTGKKAAYSGAKEVSVAVIATTATIVAVFLPVGFMGGVTGQFFKSFALTVVFAMLVSLWDSLTMAPMLSAYFANIPNPKTEWQIFGPIGRGFYCFLHYFEKSFDYLSEVYSKMLHFILPRWWISYLIFVLSILGAVWGFSNVKKNFLPSQLGATFRANMDGPLAIPIERIVETADGIDTQLKTIKSLEKWTINSSGGGSSSGINVSFTVKPEFAKNQQQLSKVRQEVRAVLQNVPGYSFRLSEPADPLSGAGGGRFQPVAVTISGDDLDKIKEIAAEVRQKLQIVKGVSDISNLQNEGLPEIQFKVVPLLAAQFGVVPQTISDNLRIWIDGDTSNSLKVGDDQIPIRVRIDGLQKKSAHEILQRNIFIKSNKGDLSIPLSNLVHMESGAGPANISRENRQRTLRVSAGLLRGAALGDVITDLKSQLEDVVVPTGYSVKVVGQSQQMDEVFSNIITAIALGSLFVYMILASLFDSFLRPVTIMVAIPLAATGAILSLIMFGIPLDLYGGIGMVLLAGIVAKNSILLVDFATQRVRDHHKSPYDAILESAPLRLRPILMTSVAMIVGMLPVAIGMGSSGEARQGLGIATIGGVISSTILTLLVVPNLFVQIEFVTTFFRQYLVKSKHKEHKLDTEEIAEEKLPENS